MYELGFILGVIIIIYIAVALARAKGRSALGWGFLAFWTGGVAILLLLILPKDQEVLDDRLIEEGKRKLCHACRGLMHNAATHCPNCGQPAHVYYLNQQG